MGEQDSIFALSSGRLPAGIAVIRISGPHCRFVLETICGGTPEPRTAALRRIRDAEGRVIDEGIVIHFPGPRSFTGEDVAEIQLHGSKAVVAAVLDLLSRLPGARHAEAGEFTRRAFLNGRLDLLEAEALADLVNAETEAQRRLAVLNREGAQSALYEGWRHRLIHGRAMLEAELDFSDEGDVPGSVSDRIWPDIAALRDDIRSHVASYRRSEIIRDGFDVVIAGPPNAGKSSLLNALADREAAIVSDEPGTTRDLVELALDLDGIKVRLTDTAGMREGAGQVEAIGIARARNRAAKADLVLHLQPVGDEKEPGDLQLGRDAVRIGTKSDLLEASRRDCVGRRFDFLVSSVTGEGISDLLSWLGSRAAEGAGSMGDVLPSRTRHVALLRDTADALERALQADASAPELRAEELRFAAERLGRISGAVDVEDLLDVVFSQFCIGK